MEIKEFKSFNIKSKNQHFEGEKIDIERVLNKKITVHYFLITDTKFDKAKGNGKCLNLQLSIDGVKRVLFTGSGNLMSEIEQVPKDDLPFTTTIIKQDRRLSFT